MSAEMHGQGRAAGRDRAEVLADAIRVLTEAARLRRPVMRQGADGKWEPHPVRTEPANWAEFITAAVAGAAANVGSVERALEGRPGSWEADAVRSMLLSTVGEDPARLLEHRTEPIRVVVRPAEILDDLGYAGLYDESRRFIQAEMGRRAWRYRLGEDRAWSALDDGAPAYEDACAAYDAAHADELDVSPVIPAPELIESTRPGTVMEVPRSAADEAARDALAEQEGALDDLQYEDDPRSYGAALKAAVLAEAGRMYPGVAVEVTVDIEERRWRDDSPYFGETPEERLIDAAVEQAPLPWSGIAPRDYPPGQSVCDAERAAGRLPHLRLGQGGGHGGEEGTS